MFLHESVEIYTVKC